MKIILNLTLLSFISWSLVLGELLDESFDSEDFPPEDWQVINKDGGTSWIRSINNTRTPPGCASCFWSEFYLTNDDWLVTPRLTVAREDTLKFYYRSFDTSVRESLEVRLSFKGPTPNNFTRVLWARRFSNTAYQLAKIPLRAYQDSLVYIAFRYYVSSPLQPIGAGIYLDDITGPEIYSVHDVGVTQIITPIGVSIESIISPQAKIKNFGSFNETIPVVFKILGADYERCETTFVLAGNDTTMSFPSCTLHPGAYLAQAYTVLTADENYQNDTCQVNFIIRTNNVWQQKENFPLIVKTTGSSLCYDEHGFIYGMRASDTNFYAYNIAQNEWQKKKSLPIKTKSGFGLIYGADDTIYVVTKNQKIVYRYSVVSNEWYLAESLPVKPKTHSAFCRQGDYIYALLGDTLFYRYSLEHNTWQQLKALPVKAKNGTSITSSDDGYIYAITGNKKAFHRYSISANNWSLLDSAPYPIKKGAGLASIGNIIYCLPGGKIKKFYKYEPGSGWYELDSVPIVIKGGNSITPAQGDIYCLLGSSTNLFFRYIPESATKKASSDLIGSLTSNVYTIIYPQLSQTRQNKFSLPQTIIIYNVLGKTILQTTLENKNQLYELIKNLPRGVFFISDNDKNHLRIIKSHY